MPDKLVTERSIPSARFRPGRQFALSWTIPDSFGGMTGALMHRSRAFVRAARRPVDVLTLDDRLDYAEVEARLLASGQFIDGMRLFNIWDWLREHDTGTGTGTSTPLPKHVHEALEPGDGIRESLRGETVLVRELVSTDTDRVVQTDRYRADGTLLVTDRRARGGDGRSVVLYDRTGLPMRSWGSVWGIYRFWLDQLIGSQPSYLIVDSKTAARFVHSYRRRNVVTLHVVHGSHRATGKTTPRLSRKIVLENLSHYDSVVLLTEEQRRDLVGDSGPQNNLAVIPNGLEPLAQPGDGAGPSTRVRGAGVMLASLTARKRVSHAVKAVVAASRSVTVQLDVFGEGERRPLLEKTIQSIGATELVRLRGHDAEANSAFLTADFTLLTSTSEGLPLVLVEAMSAGCIPIAYDIAYGPADLIRDGHNGFLVAAGDIEALAQRIATLQGMSAGAVAAMRRRARATALRFNDRAVTRAWAREMEKAFERKQTAAAGDPGTVLMQLRRKAGRVKRRLKRNLGLYR